LVVLQDLARSTAWLTPRELKLDNGIVPITIVVDGEERLYSHFNAELLHDEESASGSATTRTRWLLTRWHLRRNHERRQELLRRREYIALPVHHH